MVESVNIQIVETTLLERLKGCGIRQQDIANGLHLNKRTVSHWFQSRRAIPKVYWPDLYRLTMLAERHGREAIALWHPQIVALKEAPGLCNPQAKVALVIAKEWARG